MKPIPFDQLNKLTKAELIERFRMADSIADYCAHAAEERLKTEPIYSTWYWEYKNQLHTAEWIQKQLHGIKEKI